MRICAGVLLLFFLVLKGARSLITCCVSLTESVCNSSCSSASLNQTVDMVKAIKDEDFEIILKKNEYDFNGLSGLTGRGALKSWEGQAVFFINIEEKIALQTSEISIINIEIRILSNEKGVLTAPYLSALNFSGCSFVFNASNSSAGYLFSLVRATLRLENSSFNNLNYRNLANISEANLSIFGCVFSGSLRGQVMTSSDKSRISVSSCVFEKFQDVRHMFTLRNMSELNFSDCKFVELKEVSIFNFETLATAEILRSEFNNLLDCNVSLNNNSQVTFRETKFINNAQEKYNSSVFQIKQYSRISFVYSTLRDFELKDSSIILLELSSGEINFTLFENITNKIKGNMLSVTQASNASLFSSIIRAYRTGLGLFFIPFFSRVVLKNVSLFNVVLASVSGIFYLNENNILTIDDSHFRGVSVLMKYSGDVVGGITLKNQNIVRLINSTFDFNISGDGGLLYATQNNQIELISCKFSSSQMGAVYLGQDNTLTISGEIAMAEHPSILGKKNF